MQRYRDKKIRVCDKKLNSFAVKSHKVERDEQHMMLKKKVKK